ncbi:MAG TPA: hypothetical protein VGS57_16580 [Thermoanaerobaculia bacterium]|jgi:hypothetical protein|nr:hypothetical protein [Thermoanaerobaculia bacterium]
MALGVAVLRALPFLQLLWTGPPRGYAYLPIGYIPKDWLAYVALIRQPRDTGRLLLANPFTTEPQDGRFVLLFHQALGAVHAAIGIDPFWLLELSRVPLLLVFFAVLWRFVGHVFAERRERVWACGLVAFAGGLEPFVLPVAHAALPGAIAEHMERDLWPLYGWSGFGSFYNPLWIAALILLLVILRPLLQPGGPRGWRDYMQAGVGFVALALTHSYSAILLAAILGGVAAVELAIEPRAGWGRLRRAAIALAPAAVVVGAITAWQLRDPVFRASAGGVVGAQAASLFWLPITHGVLAFFALRGFQRWASERHPWRLAIGGWLLGVALLASSTVLNGYHFIFGLQVPLCIAAAPAIAELVEQARVRAGWRWVPVGAVALLLFASPIWITARALRDAREQSVVPRSYVPVLADLRSASPTNVLAPPELGNLIPALTPHRVWLGQWFMTPDYATRSRWYALMVEQPESQVPILRALVDQHRIGALVVPTTSAGRIAATLAPRVERVVGEGDLATIYLSTNSGRAAGTVR